MLEKIVKESKKINEVITAIVEKKDCSIFGLNLGQKSLLLDFIKKPIVYITTSATGEASWTYPIFVTYTV